MSIGTERPDDDAVPAPWVTRVVARDLWATTGQMQTSPVAQRLQCMPKTRKLLLVATFRSAQPSPAVHNSACRG